MMIRTEIQPEPIIDEGKLEPRTETDVSVLDMLVLLLGRKRFYPLCVAELLVLALSVAGPI